MNMKKLFAFILAAAMALTLFACAKAADPTASSSGLGGPKLYILADRGTGQMYYKVLELHPEPEFDGAGEPMDEKYIEYLIRCQVYEDEYRDWTNGYAEARLRGKTYLFEREYTAAQLAKFNELGLTTGKLHTLLDLSYGIDDIMKMTADQVPGSIEDKQSDMIIYNKLNAVVPRSDAKRLTLDDVDTFGLSADMLEEDVVAKLGPASEVREEDDDGEGRFGKKIYIYDGLTITFLKTLYGEPYMDEIFSAEFTSPDKEYMHGIKLGDTLYDVVAKFPQDRDYRCGTPYGDPMDKYTDGYSVLQNIREYNRHNDDIYRLIVTVGYYPQVNFYFAEDLTLSSILIKYRNDGFEE